MSGEFLLLPPWGSDSNSDSLPRSLFPVAVETRDTDNGVKYSDCPLRVRFRRPAALPHHCPFQGESQEFVYSASARKEPV